MTFSNVFAHQCISLSLVSVQTSRSPVANGLWEDPIGVKNTKSRNKEVPMFWMICLLEFLQVAIQCFVNTYELTICFSYSQLLLDVDRCHSSSDWIDPILVSVVHHSTSRAINCLHIFRKDQCLNKCRQLLFCYHRQDHIFKFGL